MFEIVISGTKVRIFSHCVQIFRTKVDDCLPKSIVFLTFAKTNSRMRAIGRHLIATDSTNSLS